MMENDGMLKKWKVLQIPTNLVNDRVKAVVEGNRDEEWIQHTVLWQSVAD